MSANERPKTSARGLDDLIDVLRRHRSELQQRYGVTSIGVFGSWVRTSAGSESDVDILVEFDDRPLSLLQFISLRDELTDMLGIPVDLVEKDVLKPRIGERVREEVVYV